MKKEYKYIIGGVFGLVAVMVALKLYRKYNDDGVSEDEEILMIIQKIDNAKK